MIDPCPASCEDELSFTAQKETLPDGIAIREFGVLFFSAEEGHGHGAGTCVGAHHAANHADRQLLHIALPQHCAVGNVLLQQGITETCVTQHQGLVEIHTAGLLNLLDQQVIALLGAPGLAQDFDLAVLNADNRLDVQQTAGESNGLGDAAALFQIFQGVQHGNQPHLFTLAHQLPGDLLGAETPVQQLQGVLHQDGAAQGDGLAVHHMDLSLKFFGGNHRTLVGTGQLGSAGQAHHFTVFFERFFKSVSAGATISIKVLSLGEELASGKFSNIDYQCGFDNVDEELDFLEKVVSIEKHFGGEIDIPSEITEDDYRVISYLATLVTGGVSTGSWSKFEVSIPVTDELKERMRSEDNSVFSLSYVGSISVSLYNRKYELNAIKRFEAVQYQNLERLKQKVDVLDIGDDIKLTFLPPDGTEGKWSDMLDTLEEA